MFNGVMHIVAAVLFAVIALKDGFNPIWMGIACGYLAIGAINLTVHAIKIRKMEKAAKKAEKNSQKAANPNTEKETTAGG